MTIADIMLLEEALEKQEKGLLNKMVRCGLIDWKILHFRDVYQYRDAERRRGVKRLQSVTNTAIAFGIGESTVYQIIKNLKNE